MARITTRSGTTFRCDCGDLRFVVSGTGYVCVVCRTFWERADNETTRGITAIAEDLEKLARSVRAGEVYHVSVKWFASDDRQGPLGREDWSAFVPGTTCTKVKGAPQRREKQDA